LTATGAVDDTALQAHYDRADVFLMSSHFEGYGMVLAEAMARGLPIVCTTGGAAAETAPDTAAIKVAPGDAAAFGAAAARLIADTDLRRRMASASWAAGQTLPTWDDTAATVAGVLRRVATQGGTP
jgi:glycosyltransferase involved in cell wall biosynthesis